MPYTAETLADLMVTKLGATGVALGLTDASAAIAEAVTDVRLILGLDDIADADDDLKTRTLAEWRAWRAALGAAAGQYDLASEGDRLERSQYFDHIARMLAESELAALRYGEAQAVLAGGSTASVTGSSVAGSPYGWPCGSEWGA